MKPIEIKNLHFSYNKERLILDDVNLVFEPNTITSVLGPNGSGKTTMLKLILGLLKPASGDIYVLGAELKQIPLRERAKLLAYVPQKHNAVFDYKVLDVCAMGRAAYSGVFSSVSRKDLDIAMESLDRMRIAHLAEKPYTQISGGEQQMVLIARALAQQAKILILDEPVTGLDYGNQIRLLKTLRELAKDGITCIKTTHYPEHALWTSGQAVFMRNGKVQASGATSEIVNSDNLRAIYDTEILVINRPIDESSVSTCLPIF